ncbi:MAG: phosphoglucomutase/phosphomannomutase family protein [Pedosphaera sp.]|nr:phosphoglucomutase/phosphomannomutase family protein [Pedosphaera sp.]
MASIKFGTDGWRAIIAEDFTFANLDRVAQATADFWTANPIPGTTRTAIVGYDRRFLSDQFAARVAEILAGNGFRVTLTDSPTPTPAISLAVKQQKAIGGVMITASHNPPAFNGFKLKAWYGGSAEPSLCQGVEAQLDTTPVQFTPLAEARKSGKVFVKNLRKPHTSALRKLVDFDLISKSRIRFAHDALFGVGAGCFDDLLAGTTCRITTLNGEYNPGFGGINPEPIAANYGKSAAWLKRHPQDICVVTDGDADRVGGMLGDGTYLSTHVINCLLLQHYVRNRGEKGRVVRSLTVTGMVDKICSQFGLPVVETGVGFKYITAEMLKGGVLLGFEESGGIGFPGHIPERDGIAAGLLLLEMLAVEHKPLGKLLAALEKDYGPHRFARIDTRFPVEKRAALMEYCKTNAPSRLLKSPVTDVQTTDGVKYTTADGSWLMLRGSGTEPILRIYAEAESERKAQALLKLGMNLMAQIK